MLKVFDQLREKITELWKSDEKRFLFILAGYLIGLLFLLLAIAFGFKNNASWVNTVRAQKPLATTKYDGNQIQAPILSDVEAPATATPDVEAATPVIKPSPDDDQVLSSSFSTDFEVPVNGFGFQNYGSRFPQGDLTINEVRILFGDEVCVQVEGDECVPTPAAQFWIDQMNQAMTGGHCVGFTILSQRLVEGQYRAADFGQESHTVFDLTQDGALMRQIAQDWVLQVTDEVVQATVGGTLREVVDELLALQQPVDLGIFHRKGGGHSMLAYGVQDQGDGIFHILVYDNNWPGKDDLFVEVDVNTNTWRYSLAATNPNEDAEAWEGNARTQSLIFVPLDAYEQKVSCPFCSQSPSSGAFLKRGLASLAQQADQPKNIVILSGDEGHLQVSNSAGQRIGRIADEYLNQMPGAQLIPMRGKMFNNAEPYLVIPGEQDELQIKVTAREGKMGRADLRMIGANISFAIDDLLVQSGQEEQMSVSTSNQSVEYTPSG